MSNLVILKWPFEYKAKVETKFEILLFAALKMLFCRVYCCFLVIVIKLISTIFNEMK